jgi:predicted phosphodiesterase
LSGLYRNSDAQNAVARVLAGKSEPKKGTLEICASLALQLLKAKLEGDQAKIESIENQFKYSPCDILGWQRAIDIYLEYYADGAAPMYRTYAPENIDDAFVYPMPDQATLRVGVIGDWGTGEQVADVVLEEVFKHEPDLLIHVGDIYYSGTPAEGRQNFLAPINRARAKVGSGKPRNIPVYNLPGNHDYYSGGQGFYELIGELNASGSVPDGTPVQEASFFCLRNEHWQLQGMDTGYFDHDVFKVDADMTHLHESEIKWHLNKLASAGDRRVIFFSHHQLFSAFLAINGKTFNPDLLEPFKVELASGKIKAWLWGHEHLLEIYGPNLGLSKGRCVGNGAFPELISQTGYKLLDETKVGSLPPLLTDPQTGTFYVTGTTDDVYNHGYAMLELGVNEGTASYYQVPGDGGEQRSMFVFKESLI